MLVLSFILILLLVIWLAVKLGGVRPHEDAPVQRGQRRQSNGDDGRTPDSNARTTEDSSSVRGGGGAFGGGGASGSWGDDGDGDGD